jgi:DhnA family fructose-bisphosphate aldolase class Ia
MQSRLSRIFNPQSNRTVMLAFDHGYFQGPTTGLERIDLSIAPLFGETDVLMCTRGILRSTVPAATNKPVVLRASGGNSILGELSNECVAVAMEDALRLNVCAVAAQVYIGSEFEHQSINNIIKLVDAGARYGMPTLAVTGWGKRWRATRGISHLPAALPPKWGRSSSKPIMWMRALKKSPPAARCRSSSPAAKAAGARGAGDVLARD